MTNVLLASSTKTLTKFSKPLGKNFRPGNDYGRFYLGPPIILQKNSCGRNLMEGGKEIDGDGEEGKSDGSSGDVTNGVKDGLDIDGDSEKGNAVQTDLGKNPVQDRVDSCMDGKEVKADSSRDENDEADDEEEEAPLASASRRLPRHRHNLNVLTSTDSLGSVLSVLVASDPLLYFGEKDGRKMI